MKVDYKPLDRVDDAKREREVSFTLPWPPSTNRVWRVGKTVGGCNGNRLTKPRVYKSEPYEKFLGTVFATACDEKIPAVKKSPYYAVFIWLFPPSSTGRYDADNRAKAVLDALTKIGMWKDDSQVVELTILKAKSQAKKPGFVKVQINAINEQPG